MEIQQRKKDHIQHTVAGQSAYSFSAGFDKIQLRHQALPELNFDEIDLQTNLFGRNFSFPLMISSMTGGYSEAGQVNRIIAEVCEQENIPMGVGSQRIMLEDPSLTTSFSVVRDVAPTAFIAGNIGGVQLIKGLSDQMYRSLTECIRADAIIVHLNPLQELMQPEGDRNFSGVLDGIAELVRISGIPVIVKETGAGIEAKTASRLIEAGVRAIDVAGAGGTSWAKVENLRQSEESALSVFNDWGIQTIDCIREVVNLGRPDLTIIASGGIKNGVDILKTLCLGAHFTASAQPIIKAIHTGGKSGFENLIKTWKKELQTAMLLVGCSHTSLLNNQFLMGKP